MDTSILLIGIGGYGDTYVRALTQNPQRSHYHIAGVVDPFAAKAMGYAVLKAMGISFYDNIEDFYKEHTADLAIISTPIPLHEKQSIYAMEHDSHVLLEKPIAATPEAGIHIACAAKKTRKKLGIGFQWCFDSAMLALKKDVDAGRFGLPLSFQALVLWHRNFDYYNRGTGWAGRKYSLAGDAIYDSVASNATAHYLENMLWMAGKGLEGTDIANIQVETWRANAIETYDTVTLHGELDGGADITYVASHAIHPQANQEPMFTYRYEKATITFGGYGQKGEHILAKLEDGTTVDYGISYNNGDTQEKLWRMLDAIQTDAPIPCPAQAALRHANAIAAMRHLDPEARVFPQINREASCVWVPHLDQWLIRCYQEGKLLSETMEIAP